MIVAGDAHSPQLWVLLLLVAVVIVFMYVARYHGKRRTVRRMRQFKGDYGTRSIGGPEDLEREGQSRDLKGFYFAIIHKPGASLWLSATILFLIATWRSNGASNALITVAIIVLIGYPLAYLWWRRWGPPN
jgi:ABC-type spermidine/putrescine transport system permease subunit I